MCSHKHCQKTVTCFPFRLSAEKSSAPLDKLSSCSPSYLQLKIKVEKKKICMFKLNPNMQSFDHCYLCFIFFLKKKNEIIVQISFLSLFRTAIVVVLPTCYKKNG